ncbi:quinolinate synthase NadA [Pelagicoccus sp. SDUM812003]|uniref:quinolinate synthase NadA n=1 Tax=Pelagicoccus sp. SDUM812003 TaxID=3041267 RepID=UPI00280E5414|nr:quinolinate synthase NadA [Pelagicoccus sp. SDUM812003]MDQ8204883.1 quinolinate synthase NadA [Pelagicoccus sp. SDUM812003]
MVSAAEPRNYSDDQIEAEANRLLTKLMHVECEASRSWNIEACREIAPLTLEINDLKREKGAVILAHSYVEPEIIYGVADFAGDSYMLSLKAKEAAAERIVFSGVVFMAETAKILSPQAEVVVPDRGSGCSLADSLTGEQLRELKKQYPDAAVVCYINSTAEVKAECDVCVTSSNVYKIVASLPQQRILFVPDRLMAENIRTEMRKLGIDKEIISSDGTCIVHDEFDPAIISEARGKFPGLKVVSHPECTLDITSKSDYVGSTGGMMQYVKSTEAPYFMMLTECGLVERIEVEAPEKRFISGCKLCPYMKLNSLEKIRDVLVAPRPEQIVTLDEELRLKALRSIDRMFEIAEGAPHQPKGC